MSDNGGDDYGSQLQSLRQDFDALKIQVPVQRFSIPNFPTDQGTTFPEIVVAYQTYGTFSPGKKVVLVSTCFGEALSRSNPLIGAGKALDPAEYFIVRIGLFGGSDSSSPSNTPAPLSRKDFPHVTYSDNVRAQWELMKSLGVFKEGKGLWAVVGFSMGGQLAYHWGVLHSDRVKHIVCLATSAETSIHNIAFLEGPKGALIASDSYDVGSKGPAAFGRAYCAWAMSHDWFQQRKWEEQGFTSLEDYISKAWSNATSDGWDLLCLAWTWQNASIRTATITPGRRDPHAMLEDALKSIKCKALVMPCRTDLYFVPEDSEMEVKYLPHGKLAVIESICGHIGGGGSGTKEDNAFIDAHVRQFLKE